MKQALVAFNTGALYTTHGQRIAAWVERRDGAPSDVACFVDFDRGVYGHFPFVWSGQLGSPTDFARHVMHMYDVGQYPLVSDLEAQAPLSDVCRNGYDAFISNPEVCVIADIGRSR